MQLLVQNRLDIDPSRATEIFSVPKRRIFALPKIVRYWIKVDYGMIFASEEHQNLGKEQGKIKTASRQQRSSIQEGVVWYNWDWHRRAYAIVHTNLPRANPVILWIKLGGKPKWLPLNFSCHDFLHTMNTVTSLCHILCRFGCECVRGLLYPGRSLGKLWVPGGPTVEYLVPVWEREREREKEREREREREARNRTTHSHTASNILGLSDTKDQFYCHAEVLWSYKTTAWDCLVFRLSHICKETIGSLLEECWWGWEAGGGGVGLNQRVTLPGFDRVSGYFPPFFDSSFCSRIFYSLRMRKRYL